MSINLNFPESSIVVPPGAVLACIAASYAGPILRPAARRVLCDTADKRQGKGNLQYDS